MLSRISALRSLNSLNPLAATTSSVVSRRWTNGSKSNVPTSGDSSSSTDATSATPQSEPVPKAWENHPDVTEYELSNGVKALMIGHNFIAHVPYAEGNRRQVAGWGIFMKVNVILWLIALYIAKTQYNLTPYPWMPLGISKLSQFDRDEYLNFKTDANHYYQNYDETLTDPNAEEEDDEDEDEDED